MLNLGRDGRQSSPLAKFAATGHVRIMTRTVHIIAGPTASGKSALAIERAISLGGAVINCDSRQIYRALPVLTAQPSSADFARVPHHLYGCIHPNDVVSAGSWRSMAMPLIERLLGQNIAPIVTGGNGLYLKALIEGLSPIPPVPAEIRARAIEKQRELGNPGFHDELKRRDPETASLYHPMHTARLIHAWEVLEATGIPLAQWQKRPKDGPPPDWRFDITLVMPERDELYRRCDSRFETMLAEGAAEELFAFDQRGAQGEIRSDAILIKTVGASALRDWRAGLISKDEATERAQTETRHYAKRQMTWFRNQLKADKNIEISVLPA